MTNEKIIIDTLQSLTAEQLTEEFNDVLDDAQGGVTICGMTYAASDVLCAVDPIAYRQEFLAWLDAECTNGRLVEVDSQYYLASDVAELSEELS
jgi:hypothetical protein